jgi:hypothetical protein
MSNAFAWGFPAHEINFSSENDEILMNPLKQRGYIPH